MYNHEAKWADSYFHNAVATPQNTTANGSSHEIDGSNGNVEIVARVATAVGIADTKVITLTVQDSADDTTFAAIHTLYTLTSSGGDTLAADTVLGRFVLPTNVRKYVRVAITTDDAAASGTISVFPRLIS